jgi:hypothetical protein
MVFYAFKHIPPSRAILQHLVDEHCDRTRIEPDDIDKNVKIELKLPAAFSRRVMHRHQDLKSERMRRSERCYIEHTDSEEEDCAFAHMKWNEKTELGHFTF